MWKFLFFKGLKKIATWITWLSMKIEHRNYEKRSILDSNIVHEYDRPRLMDMNWHKLGLTDLNLSSEWCVDTVDTLAINPPLVAPQFKTLLIRTLNDISFEPNLSSADENLRDAPMALKFTPLPRPHRHTLKKISVFRRLCPLCNQWQDFIDTFLCPTNIMKLSNSQNPIILSSTPCSVLFCHNQ